ncbi:unnamed protein product [Diamesa serratosioi]
MALTPKPIEITHFLNPNKFYFKYKYLNDSNEELQSEINEYYELNSHRNRVHFNELKKNDKLAYFCKPNWIRCEIDNILTINLVQTVIMWSLDYGYPIRIISDNKIKRLTAKWIKIPSPIMCGGLHILPAEIKFKFETMTTKRCRADQWSTRACKLFRDYAMEANALLFLERATHSDIQFGDLIAVISKTSNINMSDKLIKENVGIAETADIFLKHYTGSISHTAERWNDDKSSRNDVKEITTVQNSRSFIVRKGFEQNNRELYQNMNYEKKVLDWKERNQRSLENCELESIVSEPISITVQASNEIKTNHTNLEISMKNKCFESKKDYYRIAFQPDKDHPQQKPIFLAAGSNVSQFINNSRSAVDSPVENEVDTFSKIHEEWIPKGFNEPEPLTEEISTNIKFQHTINENIRLIKSADVARILVHGRNLTEPIEKVSEAGFCVEVEEFLKRMNFRSVYRIQAHSWAPIMNGRSIAIVNTELSGKTFSYLPAIIDMLNDGHSKDNLNKVGPVCVLIVKSSRDVENLYKIIRNIVSDDKVTIVKAYGKLNNEKAVVGLLNSCDILIATPDCFTRLVNDVVFVLLDRKRIRHVVFDNLDIMLIKSRESIKTILKLLCDFMNPAKNPQIIITSNVWIKEIEKILMYSDPIYVFGNYIECAIFAKSSFTLKKVISEQEKCEKVHDILCEKVKKSQKTMIAVNNQQDIEILRRFLSKTQITFQIYDNKMTPEDIKKQVENNDNKTVIICSDVILPSMKSIKMVQNLIHFSLPSTWTQFSYRFTVSFDYYKKVLGLSEQEKADNSNSLPSTIILLDNENNKELPRIIEFFEDHNLCKVTDQIKSMVVSISSACESLKMNSGNCRTICWNIMNLGRCPMKNGSCPYRHTLTSDDKSSTSLPSSGLVKFEIVNILSAKQYCIKILHHLPSNSENWESWENANKMNQECQNLLANYYQQSENVQIHHPCLINDLCSIFVDNTWKRCRVLKIKQNANSKNYTFVEIKLIDFGVIMNVKSTQLMELPNFLQIHPPGVVDLYLKDIIPFDGDDTFDHESTVHLKSLLKSKMRENCFMICDVSFLLLDSIFANNIEIRQYLPAIKCNLPVLSIKKHLLSTNRCCLEPNVSKNLETLALSLIIK